jgi:hypothetical protein
LSGLASTQSSHLNFICSLGWQICNTMNAQLLIEMGSQELLLLRLASNCYPLNLRLPNS